MDRKMVVNRPFSEIVPQSPMKLLKAAVKETIFVDRLLCSYQRPDRLLDLHVYPTADGAIVFFRDLTEQELQQQRANRIAALLQSALDTLSEHVIVLDRTGTIVASNAAWQKFASAEGLVRRGGESLNYLALYRSPLVRQQDGLKVGKALTSLLSGSCRTARVVYSWPRNGEARWFQLNGARFECAGDTYVALANGDVTAVKEAQEISGQMADRLLTLQEEERQHIAGDLHDSTAQHLVAISLNVMRLKCELESNEQFSDLFKEIEGSVSEMSKEIRILSHLLHPPRLEEDGLRATAELYARGFGGRTGLNMKVRVARAADTLAFGLQRCLFRIMQEALTNVHRHSRASEVRLDLRCLHQQVHFLVSDDGVGIVGATGSARSTSRSPSMGVGIPGMRARLRQFGGELKIRSGPTGTCLHAIVPLAAGG